MLRAIIILLLFHSISIAVFSQNYKQLGESQQSREARVRFKKAVKLNWSLPGISSPVYSTNTSFDLALEIESAYTISDKNITLYVDGKSIDGKAGEASIKKKKSLDKYIFEYSLVQPKDKKVTRIDVSVDINGEIHKSTQMEVRHQFDNEKANLHLVSIGIGTYHDESDMQNLAYPEKDAETFFNLFRDQGDLIFKNIIRHRLMKGNDAYSGNIIAKMNELKQDYQNGEITPQDLIIIFISSHGLMHENDFKIATADFKSSVVNRTTVSYKKDIINVLKEVDCKKLVFLDACYSGAAEAGAKNFKQDLAEAIQKTITTSAGVTTITSSSAKEKSYELQKYQHGTFTQALKEAFSGKANRNNDSYLDLDEIFTFLAKRVPQLNKEEGKNVQTPSRSDNQLGALPIYILN